MVVDAPFHQAAGAKTRPVIVVMDSGDSDFVAVPITSKPRQWPFELALQDWAQARLHHPSFVRVDKILVLAKASIHKELGYLSKVDSLALRSLLCTAFCPSIH